MIINPMTHVTTISFAAQVPMPSRDRREDNRYVSVLRSAKLVRAHRDELCLIRNISAGGLMAHVFSEYALGEAIGVELREGQLILGQAAWHKDGRIGMKFDQPIDVLALLAGIQMEEGTQNIPRAPRLNVQGDALLRYGADDHPVRFQDISQGGMKIEVPEGVGRLARVVMTIGGLGAYVASLGWKRGNLGGVIFTQPIPFDALAKWAVAQGAS